MVALSLDYDYEKAAGLVARGNELEAAAAKTKIPFEHLKEYTMEYAEVWHRIIKNERQQLLGQAGAEALTVLRNLIRNGEEKTQVAAATILMKFWMTTLRHDKGGNAFDALEGGLSDLRLARELEAEDKEAAEYAAKYAPKSEIEPPETSPIVPTIETPPCDVPAIVEAEIVVEAPSVPEKPVRPDEIEIFPTLNPSRSGLLGNERRPLSHDRGGGQPWERSETFCLNDERSPRK